MKTDRRDAEKLARLLRSGELTAVWVPDEAHEALRDFTRLRESAKQDLHRARQQLGKFLLRLSVAPTPRLSRWSKNYRAWLSSPRLPQALEQATLEVYLEHLDERVERLAKLNARLEELAVSHEQAPLIQAFACLYGVALVTAIT